MNTEDRIKTIQHILAKIEADRYPDKPDRLEQILIQLLSVCESQQTEIDNLQREMEWMKKINSQE